MPGTIRAFGRELSNRQASVWILEALQSVFALVILGITVSAANGFKHDLQTSDYPAKLKYNIAIAAFTFGLFAIILTLDIVQRPFSAGNAIDPRWYHITLNILFFGLWIGAVASSVYYCSDLCPVAPLDNIRYAGICCDCTETRLVPCNLLALGYGANYEQRTHRYEATIGLDVVVMLLFLTSISIMIWLRWKKPVYRPRPRPQGPMGMQPGPDGGLQAGGLGTG